MFVIPATTLAIFGSTVEELLNYDNPMSEYINPYTQKRKFQCLIENRNVDVKNLK